MPVFTKERTARKAYKCQRCLGLIRPGERYRAYSIPPGSDLDNDGWISGREHLDVNCVLYQDEPPAPEDWQGLPLKETARILPPEGTAAAPAAGEGKGNA